MRFTAIILVICFYTLSSCNNTNENKKAEVANTAVTTPAIPPQSALGNNGTGKLMAVLSDYYMLKNALVATDAAKADEAGNKLMTSIDSMQTSLATDSTNRTALQPYIDTIKQQDKEMLALKDETCEKKRIYFSKISDQVYNIVKSAKLQNAGIYHQFCPMAFNDKGGYWLSAEAEIKNPYFGKKMLECGETVDSLK